MKGHDREILTQCVEGESYQGTTQRDAKKGLLSRIYITGVARDLYPGTIQQRHMKSLAR